MVASGAYSLCVTAAQTQECLFFPPVLFLRLEVTGNTWQNLLEQVTASSGGFVMGSPKIRFLAP
ncbi:MAG: hypothetical protein HPY54_07115 [Chthonomonadetes bacterium]|nr:hypothetical protein [Chthonomonadetes bacterium]